jgi:hypothetical protein
MHLQSCSLLLIRDSDSPKLLGIGIYSVTLGVDLTQSNSFETLKDSFQAYNFTTTENPKIIKEVQG